MSQLSRFHHILGIYKMLIKFLTFIFTSLISVAALAQPATTKPNAINMLVTPCAVNTLIIGNGIGASPLCGPTMGTGIATALSINVGTAGAPVINGGAMGTPSSGVGTALTALNASNLASGTVAQARGGAGTITGALKGSGAGIVTQAACADLSNGGTACAQNYTQGVWTPIVTTSGTVGTPAYAFQVGTYEQIGRQITARFSLDLSAWAGSPTGNVSISGLPVASASTANDFGTCYISNYTVTGLASGSLAMTAYIVSGTTTLNLLQGGNTSTASVTAAQFGAAGLVFGTCNYHT